MGSGSKLYTLTKKNAPEIKLIPRVDAINLYLDDEMIWVRERIEQLPKEPPRDWEELDNLFLSALSTST